MAIRETECESIIFPLQVILGPELTSYQLLVSRVTSQYSDMRFTTQNILVDLPNLNSLVHNVTLRSNITIFLPT